jgi:NADH-quinone oxidoreductase subunit N
MNTAIKAVLEDSRLFLPELVLSAAMLLVVLVDASRARARDAVNFVLTGAALVAALVLCLPLRLHAATELWSGMVVLDPVAVFFKLLLIGASLIVLVMFRRSRELAGLVMSEFYALLLAVTVSTLLLAASNDLAMLYLALEMVSVTSYVMVAYMKGDKLSNEASLKYILFGAVSTGVMLYGLSLMYGLTGSTSLPIIRDALAGGLTDENRLALYVIALLVFAGFGFKTAAVPFHFWCPDVYQGAPTPVTAFLSVAPKAAGFAIMLRFFSAGLATRLGSATWDLIPTIDWQPVLMLVSVLTMTVGNVAALTQTNMKRLLAYSSIAHAGYILMGVVALSENGARSILVYLLAYVFMNLGAFLIVTLIHYYDGSFELRDYPGLYRRAPFLTVAMAIFLLSLMGIPPLVGFMGKLYVFSAVVQAAQNAADPGMATRLYVFAVIGAVNAAVGAFYYARVLKTMVIEAGNEDKAPLPIPALDSAWVLLLVLGNVLPLLFWEQIQTFTSASLRVYAGN